MRVARQNARECILQHVGRRTLSLRLRKQVAKHRGMRDEDMVSSWRDIVQRCGQIRLSPGPVVDTGDQYIPTGMLKGNSFIDEQAASVRGVRLRQLGHVNLCPVLPIAQGRELERVSVEEREKCSQFRNAVCLIDHIAGEHDNVRPEHVDFFRDPTRMAADTLEVKIGDLDKADSGITSSCVGRA